MDDNKQPAQDVGISPTSGDEQPPVPAEEQNPPAQEQQNEAEESGSQPSGQEAEESHEPSRFERRQERHIERLTDQLRQGFDQNRAYRERLVPPQRDSYQPLRYEDGADYDKETLERDREAYATRRAAEAVSQLQSAAQQEFFIDRMERDVEYISSRTPQLDESASEFDPDLADSVNRLYLATIGYNPQTGVITNPGIRYRDFASAFMGALDKVKTSESADTAQNLARQSGRAGVRPTVASRRHQLGDLSRPGAISDLDSETYEKNKDAINDRILQELGVK